MQEHNHARQEIAAQLRQVRKEQGMTQERLAEKVGTRKSNISRLESGRYNPSLDFLEKVAGGLGREIEVKSREEEDAKSMTMKLGNYKDNDVELCRTTNSRVSTHSAEALLEQHIPFTKNSKKIPFFKRETYQGADTLWVITINPRRYGQARRVIDGMDRAYREHLVLSNY